VFFALLDAEVVCKNEIGIVYDAERFL